MNKLIKAIQSTPIKEMPQEAITRLLARVCVLYGIQIPIEAKSLLIDHVMRWYPSLGINEVLHAMEWNLTRPEPVKPFGVLSVAFIGEVMAKYREHRQQVIREARAKKILPEYREVTGQELYEGLKEFKELPEHYAWGKVYDYLVDKDLLSLNLEEKRRIKSQATTMLRDKWKRIPSEAEVKNECYRISVSRFIVNR